MKFATAEVGQGFVMLAQQIARTILGVDEVVLDTIDTQIGSAGSTSASRQTWMSGGALDAACRKVRERLFEHVAAQHGLDPLRLAIDGTDVVDTFGDLRIAVAEASAGLDLDETVEYRHRPTEDLDENGQGNCHVAFAFVAHRAVVDVDPDLGLVKVVQVATAQDIGRALNPLSVIGQIEGGIAQGLGLAVMEEIVVDNGRVRNPSFTDYLLPTALDAPEVVASLIEEPDPQAPLGAKGVGEPPASPSPPPSPTPSAPPSAAISRGSPSSPRTSASRPTPFDDGVVLVRGNRVIHPGFVYKNELTRRHHHRPGERTTAFRPLRKATGTLAG